MNEVKYVVPAATLEERPDGYTLKAQLPGVAKEDAELHVEGKTLTLKATPKCQNPAGFKQVAREFDYENYAMSLDLPEMADLATLEAKLADGVLTVNVKKRPETQPKKIAIG